MNVTAGDTPHESLSLTFSTGDGTDEATMVFTGTIANINTALEGMTFDPTPEYNGAASVQITTNVSQISSVIGIAVLANRRRKRFARLPLQALQLRRGKELAHVADTQISHQFILRW